MLPARCGTVDSIVSNEKVANRGKLDRVRDTYLKWITLIKAARVNSCLQREDQLNQQLQELIYDVVHVQHGDSEYDVSNDTLAHRLVENFMTKLTGQEKISAITEWSAAIKEQAAKSSSLHETEEELHRSAFGKIPLAKTKKEESKARGSAMKRAVTKLFQPLHTITQELTAIPESSHVCVSCDGALLDALGRRSLSNTINNLLQPVSTKTSKLSTATTSPPHQQNPRFLFQLLRQIHTPSPSTPSSKKASSSSASSSLSRTTTGAPCTALRSKFIAQTHVRGISKATQAALFEGSKDILHRAGIVEVTSQSNSSNSGGAPPERERLRLAPWSRDRNAINGSSSSTTSTGKGAKRPNQRHMKKQKR
ncbi:hypothetical protein Pelo_18974 [Pelomyxa schiedti]|nr:hypothetical protein Pelo_18974 [Pelomyxa schiedti]